MKLMLRVRLVQEQDTRKPIAGVKLALYDRDWKSSDDYLGTGVTDAKGEAYIQFEDKSYQDSEDGPDWRAESLPDLYVNLLDAQDKVVYTTRDAVERDRFPMILIIPVPQSIAESLSAST